MNIKIICLLHTDYELQLSHRMDNTIVKDGLKCVSDLSIINDINSALEIQQTILNLLASIVIDNSIAIGFLLAS